MAIYWRNGWAYGRKELKGVQYRQALGTRSKREAESAYQRWLGELEDAAAPTRKSASFRKAVDIFTEHHLPRLKKSSQVRYLQSLLNLTPHMEKKSLLEIDKVELAKYVAARRKEGVKDPTIIRDLACLSSVFTIASDYELAPANPVLPFLRAHKKRKSLVNADARTRYLSHAEELAILSYAAELARKAGSIRKFEKWMIAAALVGYLDTGMRAQELLSMTWPWVDLGRLEITVPADEAKSRRSRKIPILPRFERILRAMPRNKHTDLVFFRTDAGRGFDDLNHTFQRYAKAVGVDGVMVHDLRRTCGCRLLQDHKASLEVVSKWLGHASVVTTEKVYAFVKVENLHEAVGTRRSAEDLRPKLDAVLHGEVPQTSMKGVTLPDTPDFEPVDIKERIEHYGRNHNP